MSKRVSLLVEVNLDPVPGTFHQAEDFEYHIQTMLNNAFPWYEPKVTVEAEA